jgi:hypothetical protein
MPPVVEEILHILIDVASGIRSTLGDAEGKRLHELVTPPPPPAPEVTPADLAAFQAWQAAQARAQAAAQAEATPPVTS